MQPFGGGGSVTFHDNSWGHSSPDPMSNAVPGFIGVFFVIVIGFIIYAILRAATEAINNSNQPVIALTARVVAKRTNTSGNSTSGHTSTSYYATFEWEGGERREFGVRGDEWGLLAEGDYGTLTYQGTWYKGFIRDRRR